MLKKKEKEVLDAIPEPEKKEEQKKWVVGQVATKTEPVFYNNETKEQLDMHDLLCSMRNDIDDLIEFLVK